ncbi:hypothetical protein V6N11_072714 [Hibiscus sabdariffa]|uniref:Secreted protein n=1 Tax=Hibiscus sabdariffa TaxID=183260 RepID=A0ABR1ZBB0_9ROSI
MFPGICTLPFLRTLQLACGACIGTDDDLPSSHQNRFQRGGRTAAGNGRLAVAPFPRIHGGGGDMETQIHLIEQEA